MPLVKRALVALALLGGASLLALAAWLAAGGHRWPAAGLLAVALGAAAVAADVFWVRWDFTGASLRRGRRDAREVALTFDDGPGPDTAAVLDALDAAGVKATFFVLGKHAEQRPRLVMEAARRGHLVALHGHRHRKLHLASHATVAAEIDRGREAVRGAGVEPAPFFRAPHGLKGPVLRRALGRRGLRLVGWTRGVWDTERPGASAIVERACRDMRGGEILLLHDGCGSPGIDPRRDQTAAAIPDIVRRWEAAGYRFVTVDRLASAPRRAPWGHMGRALGLALLAGLTAVAVRDLDWAALGRALASASLPLLALAALVNLAGLAAQAGRWHFLLEPAARGARFHLAFRALVGGYAVGLVVPARAGDLARVHLHARQGGASRAALAGTLALDHVMSTVTLVAVVAALACSGLGMDLPAWARTSAWISVAAAAGAGAVLWWLRPRAAAGRAAGVRGFLLRLQGGLAAAGKPRALAASATCGVVGWIAEGLIALACLAAFGLPPALESSVLLVLATTLSAVASVAPGNAGAFELASVLALASLGVPREAALAFALGYHVVHIVPVALVGGVFVLQGGGRTAGFRADSA